ncbi:MAG: MFS transporter [Leptonema sp. (in: Bacteria)]|nr:MFS transporter [Leptonema sp. (in: bacteria)]
MIEWVNLRNSFSKRHPTSFSKIGTIDMKPKQGFSAFSAAGYSPFLITFTLTMMADNIEHVISYYVIFQKFKSPALAGVALSSWYYVAILFLFGAGFFELSFSSMSQTIVQMNAPDKIRGKVLGLFNVASSGLRLFSGITVGLVGSAITIHTSLAGASLTFMLVCVIIAFAIMRTYRHRALKN